MVKWQVTLPCDVWGLQELPSKGLLPKPEREKKYREKLVTMTPELSEKGSLHLKQSHPV